MPRIRTIFAVFKRNQDHPRPDKRFATIQELGALLDPERPLGDYAVRRVLDIMGFALQVWKRCFVRGNAVARRSTGSFDFEPRASADRGSPLKMTR